MRWQITTKANPSGEGVLADRLDVRDGSLVFTNAGSDNPVIVYAPGTWLVAWPEDD